MNLRLPPHITHEALSEGFGFPLPAAFAEAVILAAKESKAVRQDVLYFFEESCGFYLEGERARYQSTPAELFPVGSMGVDGVHYGYLIHAPDLPDEDYPMGELCPMDSEGVMFLGRNTAEGFENLISMQLSYSEDDDDQPLSPETVRRIELLSNLLKIAPCKEKAERCYNSSGNGLPVTPRIPDGWLHLSSSDGVGVLAPASLFEAATGICVNHYRTPPTWYIDQAEKALARGFPATALLHLREGYWHHWTVESMMLPFLEALQRAYLSLNRPQLAHVLEAYARK